MHVSKVGTALHLHLWLLSTRWFQGCSPSLIASRSHSHRPAETYRGAPFPVSLYTVSTDDQACAWKQPCAGESTGRTFSISSSLRVKEMSSIYAPRTES